MGIIDQVKEKLDIVEVIGEYIKLTKAGVNYKALCPFHKEKTPSFMVSPERQIWHCFGCHRGGDIFKFVMQYENIDFPEALRILAKKAGIELKREDPLIQNQISKLYEIYETATLFFEEQLKKQSNVLDYLRKRGLKNETIETWQLGFALNQRDVLFRFLLQKKFKIEDILLSGLVIKSSQQDNSYFDRFRNRIIFPIFNHQDRIVAFTGRIFGEAENEPKYLNSPESPIFNKSQILYGFSKTKKDIREANSVILVEGQMDFLMSWQNGIKNVIATSGTALTEDHLKILKRLTKNLIIGYDMDEAGRLAAERAIDMARSLDLQVKIISLPEGYKDIADFALSNPNELKKIIEKAEDAGEYYYRKAHTQFDLENLAEKRKAIEFLLSKIAWIDNPVERAEWLKRIAEGFHIREEFLQESLEKIKNVLNKGVIVPISDEKNITTENIIKTRHELLGEQVLALALKLKIERRNLEEIANFLVEEHQKLARFILESSEFNLNNESIWETLGYLNLLADYEFSEEAIDWNLEFEKISLELKKECLRRNIEITTQKLKEAEFKKNEEEVNQYLEELNKLLK